MGYVSVPAPWVFGSDNDLPAMIRKFNNRIHFLHLRSTKRNDAGDFYEENHLEGDVDMYDVIKEIVHMMQSRTISPFPCVPIMVTRCLMI